MACAALLGLGRAEAFPALVGPDPVVEYYNTFLGHYFMTIFPGEMEDIEAGKAGPGWVKTGLAFKGCTLALGLSCLGSNSAIVKRFYGTPGLGPNSHFYTADPAEAQGLERPGTGWTLEGIAFGTAVPDSTGHCRSGTPVIRLYNQRFMFNDSNHRYVTSESERALMVARGWVDEGVRFCSDGAVEVPIKSYLIATPFSNALIRPSAQCEDETLNIGPCIAVNNLPTPAALMTPVQNPPTDFFQRTGFTSSWNYVLDPSQPATTSASNVFFQVDGTTMGVHVDTRDKGVNQLSSLNPLYQFHTSVVQGAPDLRFFPFGTYESDVQLSVSFTLNVKTINVRSAGGAAYGHPTVEFIDQKSGHHLYFTVLTYGTVPIADYLAPDTGTGKVIVGTTFRDGSPYGRSFGLPTLSTPPGFQSPNFWGWGGAFGFRMDRGEFQRVLDAARTVDSALSPQPADYLVDNFHFNNEVFGDGEIGINLANFRLELLRR